MLASSVSLSKFTKTTDLWHRKKTLKIPHPQYGISSLEYSQCCSLRGTEMPLQQSIGQLARELRQVSRQLRHAKVAVSFVEMQRCEGKQNHQAFQEIPSHPSLHARLNLPCCLAGSGPCGPAFSFPCLCPRSTSG